MRHSRPLMPIRICLVLLVLAAKCVLVAKCSERSHVVRSQEELVASPGDSVTLECEIRNNETRDSGTIRWLLNGDLLSEEEEELPESGGRRRRPFFNATHGVHVLRIDHALIEDDGVWHCQGVPRDHEALTFTSQPIRLIVAIAPQKPYLVFEDRRLADGATFTIQEKYKVTFSCVVGAANPAPSRVDWLLGNGINLTEHSHTTEEYSESERLYHSVSAVTFEVTRKDHRKPLHCHVYHLTQTHHVTAMLTFNIQYTPSFTISRVPGFGYPIGEGIAVSLRCEVDANPSSTAKWVKDDGPLPSKMDSEDGYLNFSSIAREHAGWYRCSTQHKFGHFASFGYFLNVRFACKPTPAEDGNGEAAAAAPPPCPLQYAPEVVNQNEEEEQRRPQIQVDLGGAIMLECTAEGSPPPSSYCWARVKDGGRLESVAMEHNLLLDRILYTDAGVYKCIARDDRNRPPSRDVEVVVTGKPRVEPVNQTLMAIVGKSLRVKVQYCANPKPSRTHWIVRSYVLKPGEVSERFVAHNLTAIQGSHCFLATLDILQVEREDAGEITFLVKNSEGIEDGVVWLNITQASFSVSLGRLISQASYLPVLSLLILITNLVEAVKR